MRSVSSGPARRRVSARALASAALAGCALTAGPIVTAWSWQSGVSPGSTSGTTTDNSANTDQGQAVQIDLRATLEKGLRARRPQEFRYLAQIAQMVTDGDLPESLVRTTFGWARTKRPYPFQYFQRAMQVRARKLGIALPTV